MATERDLAFWGDNKSHQHPVDITKIHSFKRFRQVFFD